MMRLVWAMTALVSIAPIPAAAQIAVDVKRQVAVISDAVNTANPRALPGAVVDVSLTVTNPAGNTLVTVAGVRIEDTVPAAAAIRVADLGATGSGPVEFTDGGLLGLLGSNVTFRYGGLSDATDGVDFYDGTSWTYVPVPDANGYDVKVRAIRIRVTGSQRAGGAFRLRYRTRLK